MQVLIDLFDRTDEEIQIILLDPNQSLIKRSVKAKDIESIRLVYRPKLNRFINLGVTFEPSYKIIPPKL